MSIVRLGQSAATAARPALVPGFTTSPLGDVLLADARRQLDQAIASLRRAADASPAVARRAGAVHASLVDARQQLQELVS